MSKTFDDVIAALGGLENGQELIDAAKARLAKVNDEAKGLRTRLHQTETKMSKVFELAGIDVTTDESALEDAFKSVSSKKPDDEKTSKMQKQIDDLINKNKIAEQKLFDKNVTEKISEKLAAKKVLDGFRNPIRDVLKLRVRDDNGKLVYRSDDGTEVDFDEGIDSYITANPSIISNDQNAGGGTKAPNGQGAGKQITKEEFSKLDPLTKRDFIVKEKGTII